jgi:pimeloyl-ACP methyl ester carboxylesterase
MRAFVFPLLSTGYRVIAFDVPYHGRSNPPDGWWLQKYLLTMKGYLALVRSVWLALGLERPVVMGGSMGGAQHRRTRRHCRNHPARRRPVDLDPIVVARRAGVDPLGDPPPCLFANAERVESMKSAGARSRTRTSACRGRQSGDEQQSPPQRSARGACTAARARRRRVVLVAARHGERIHRAGRAARTCSTSATISTARPRDRALDLVISVYTSTAHLAGALGRPLWIMLRVPTGAGLSNDVALVPAGALVRQPTLGDWAAVVRDVGTALGGLRAQHMTLRRRCATRRARAAAASATSNATA